MRFSKVAWLAVWLVACDSSNTVANDAADASRRGEPTLPDGGPATGLADGGGEPADAGEGGEPDVEVTVDDDAGAPVPDAAAPVPASKRFDLAQPSFDVFRKGATHESRAPQGLAVDTKNGRLFMAQLQAGSSGDDLCINELDFSGKVLGFMHLAAAGHGVSIGAEASGKDTYLWVETDSSNTTETGRGTALLRFKFESGKAPNGTKFLTGSKTITAATDPVNERLVVRRIEDGSFYYSVFPLAKAAKGDFAAPLVRFKQPALSDKEVVFQGYTVYGQYLYTLDGVGHDNAADIDSFITAIDMNTGKVKSRALTKAGSTLPFREPEGMAIHRLASGETRLIFGFYSRDGANRFENIFYKNVLID